MSVPVHRAARGYVLMELTASRMFALLHAHAVPRTYLLRLCFLLSAVNVRTVSEVLPVLSISMNVRPIMAVVIHSEPAPTVRVSVFAAPVLRGTLITEVHVTV